MKLLRRAELVRSLFDYVEGKKTIGQCIDDCRTFDLNETIGEINNVINNLNDLVECESKGLNYTKNRLPLQIEKLRRISMFLAEWGYEE